ncbi:MAG: family molecular chaperone regulator, partial [Pseudomonadota bacterium]|nr:family molecular chaperone regulator [Pseudomonadota bacterium]
GNKFHSSPLDVDLDLTRDWTAPQLEAYARAVLITYADRLSNNNWNGHSFSLTRAFDKFKYACLDVYRLDGVEDGDPDIRERLRVCVRFVTDLIELIEKHEKKLVIKHLKTNKDRIRRDIYDQVAELMSEIIYNASGIKGPWWPCWEIQHNTVWTNFFDRIRESKTRRIIGFKLRRLIYEEIIEFDKYTDLKSFKAARYLGICLNCMGLKFGDKTHRDRNTGPLKKVVLGWVKKNYLSLHKNHPTVAEACLMGGITYDAENMQLIKTYASYADREPAREVFSLSE